MCIRDRVRQPLLTMVFDGCAPSVRRWNGYVPSLKSNFKPGTEFFLRQINSISSLKQSIILCLLHDRKEPKFGNILLPPYLSSVPWNKILYLVNFLLPSCVDCRRCRQCSVCRTNQHPLTLVHCSQHQGRIDFNTVGQVKWLNFVGGCYGETASQTGQGVKNASGVTRPLRGFHLIWYPYSYRLDFNDGT